MKVSNKNLEELLKVQHLLQILDAELNAIKITIDAISSKASKIDSLGGVIDGLKQQFDTIALKANSVEGLSLESIKDLGGKINTIEQKMASVSDIVKRQDASTAEFHKKSEKLFEEMQTDQKCYKQSIK